MKIGIDIDGCVANFIPALNKLILQTYGRKLQRRNWEQYDIAPFLGIPEKDAKTLIFATIKLGMEPMAGATDALRRLNKEHEITLVTSRPKVTLPDTRKWLRNWDIPHDSLVRKEPLQKYKIRPRFSVFVEDNLREAHLLVEDGTPVIVYMQPWNHSYNFHERFIRAGTWGQVEKAINDIAAG
jgi:uncharacterized HAD superfamily protein